jgi:hypothetical protein
MSLNDVLTNDESYQRQWESLERGLVDALSEHENPILPVSHLHIPDIKAKTWKAYTVCHLSFPGWFHSALRRTFM